MQKIDNVLDMQEITRELKIQQEQIGFVPTMGYIHEGHLSLVKQAKEENTTVIVSIFVNPLQFGPDEDFETYPRDLKHDLKKLQEMGVDYVFTPTTNSMYPKKMGMSMHMEERVDVLCGRSRPTHFDGVITVLTKLFNIVQATNAYFGQKDAQQIAVVHALVRDLNIPTHIISVPIVREVDGLALSSRNTHLLPDERECAPYIYKALQYGQTLIQKGKKDRHTIIQSIRDMIEKNTSGKIDYIDILNYPSLDTVEVIEGPVIIATAVYFTHARLIDNVIINNI